MIDTESIEDTCKFTYIKHDDIKDLVFPKEIDLHKMYKYEVFDQEEYMCCTSSTIASLEEYLRQTEGKPYHKLSRLFVYYYSRFYDGKLNQNKGIRPEAVIKTIIKNGICEEEEWPFKDNIFNVMPSHEAISEALSNIKDTSIEIIDPTKECIMYLLGILNKPIIASIMCFEDFNKFNGRFIIVPSNGCSQLHSVLFVGYTNDYILFQNSWGTDWGDGGFGKLSWSYVKYIRTLWGLTESSVKDE